MWLKRQHTFPNNKKTLGYLYRICPRKLFLLTLGMTVAIFLVMELYCEGKSLHRPPPHQPQQFYLTANWWPSLGIGNELFLYASISGLAKNHSYLIPVLPKEIKIRNLFYVTMKSRHSKYLGSYQYFADVRANTFVNFSEEIVPSFSVYIDSYIQSWKYFAHVEEEIRKEFTIKEDILKKAQAEVLHILPTSYRNINVKYVRVGVHVRRGDMTRIDAWFKGYTVADAEYFSKAMQYFRQRYDNIVFIVCTNDMKWSKANIHGEDVFFSESASSAVDFAILATSDHVIMSVGSYGWWAAWLANGTTIYYKDWPYPGSEIWGMVKHEDYFLPHWIPM